MAYMVVAGRKVENEQSIYTRLHIRHYNSAVVENHRWYHVDWLERLRTSFVEWVHTNLYRFIKPYHCAKMD